MSKGPGGAIADEIGTGSAVLEGSVDLTAASAVLFLSAEVTGDVIIGERTITGAGVTPVWALHLDDLPVPSRDASS